MSEQSHEGGEHRVYTVEASPNEQHELELRRRAEEIADRAHKYSSIMKPARLAEDVALIDATENDWEEIPEKPYNREEAVQEVMNILRAQESYANRSMEEIVRDTLSWVDVALNQDQEYELRHSLYREAHSVLIRAGEGKEKTESINPTLLGIVTKWASLEYFSYNDYRDWPDEEDGVTIEAFAEMIEKAGITKEEFEKLVNDPIDEEAEKFAKERKADGFDQMWGNYVVLEKAMLERAKAVKFEFGTVHNYGNYLTSMGV